VTFQLCRARDISTLLQHNGLDCPAVAPKIKTSVLRVLLSASARGIKGDLNLEKIPESGELNNMLPRQNRAN
jgi:hypothetical protein